MSNDDQKFEFEAPRWTNFLSPRFKRKQRQLDKFYNASEGPLSPDNSNISLLSNASNASDWFVTRHPAHESEAELFNIDNTQDILGHQDFALENNEDSIQNSIFDIDIVAQSPIVFSNVDFVNTPLIQTRKPTRNSVSFADMRSPLAKRQKTELFAAKKNVLTFKNLTETENGTFDDQEIEEKLIKFNQNIVERRRNQIITARNEMNLTDEIEDLKAKMDAYNKQIPKKTKLPPHKSTGTEFSPEVVPNPERRNFLTKTTTLTRSHVDKQKEIDDIQVPAVRVRIQPTVCSVKSTKLEPKLKQKTAEEEEKDIRLRLIAHNRSLRRKKS